MFCPKCGNADQQPEAYCRNCGTYLPDLSKPANTTIKPEQHVLANTVLSGMTIAASFTLSILLWSILAFRPETHPLIYVTAGLLFAMGIWHIQTLWRTLQLRKHLAKMRPNTQENVLENPPETKVLNTANLDDLVPASVTEQTTRNLQHKAR